MPSMTFRPRKFPQQLKFYAVIFSCVSSLLLSACNDNNENKPAALSLDGIWQQQGYGNIWQPDPVKSAAFKQALYQLAGKFYRYGLSL